MAYPTLLDRSGKTSRQEFFQARTTVAVELGSDGGTKGILWADDPGTETATVILWATDSEGDEIEITAPVRVLMEHFIGVKRVVSATIDVANLWISF